MWDGRREREERIVDDLMEAVMRHNIKISLEKKKKLLWNRKSSLILYRKHSMSCKLCANITFYHHEPFVVGWYWKDNVLVVVYICLGSLFVYNE